MPKISVIMNCLNGERFLPSALSCLQAQTCQDYEVIFWDNASTDESAEIAQAFGKKLRYFCSSETVPLGHARNLAIAQAKGEFIAFLDCDDIWRPAKLEKQLALFEKDPRTGLICTDTEVCEGQRLLYRMFERYEPLAGNAFAELMRSQWISMSSAMIRKKALDSIASQNASPDAPPQWFDESLNVCEEADVFYRIAHDWQLNHIDEPLTVWRIHAANTTFSKFGQFAGETLAILAKHRRLFPEYDSQYGDIAALLERRAAFQGAIALWRDGNGREARRAIEPHMKEGPKYRLFWLLSFLPGAMFDIAARAYFSLPSFLRK